MGQSSAPGTLVGLLGTLTIHAGALALVLVVVRPPKLLPPAYAVELVAAPAPAPKQRLAPAATPTPPPEPVAPPRTVTPKVKAAPVPPPKTPPKAVEPQQQEKAPRTSSPATPLPSETPSTGTDVATVKTPGLAFPYPEYLRNIVNQVYRRWGTPSVALQAEISFLILRDGSVRDIRFVTRSGNFSFDLDAQGAVEAAGTAKDFGPLPDGWGADVLPVTFYFQPPSR